MSSIEANETKLANAKLIQKLANTESMLESPINLDMCQMTVIDLPPLQWCNYSNKPRKLKVTNAGYTAILSVMANNGRAHLIGGPLRGTYIFSQIHFHWGRNAMNGSEHTVDGASFPMELHAVHFKSSYLTINLALQRKDGIAIIVYLLKLQSNSNGLLTDIANILDSIQPAQASCRLKPKPLTDILRPFSKDYFVYWGAVTSPTHAHRLLWLISREPMKISLEQIEKFRTLQNEAKFPILENHRPIQSQQNRHVFHVNPSGSRYASLLPLPHGPPVAIMHEDVLEKEELEEEEEEEEEEEVEEGDANSEEED